MFLTVMINLETSLSLPEKAEIHRRVEHAQ